MRPFLVSFFAFLLFLSPVFADYPQRIISGMPSITEMLYALDLEDRVVGVTTNCNYPPEAGKKEKVGGFFLNLEKVVSLEPDLVVMLEDAQKKDIKRFKDFGLPVYTMNPKSVKDVIDNLVELGKKTGAQKEAQALAAKMKLRISSVEAKVKTYKPSLLDVLQLWSPKSKQRKALVIVGFNPLIVAGGGTFIDDILKHAGVENIAERSKAAYPQYSFEKLVEENPPYIIITKDLVTKQQVEREKRWCGLDAVKEGRILFIDADILSRPGPRVVEAVEKTAEFIR